MKLKESRALIDLADRMVSRLETGVENDYHEGYGHAVDELLAFLYPRLVS